MKTLKVLSALLTYPGPELASAGDALKAAIAAEGVLPKAAAAAVIRLIDDLAGRDIFDAQERYVLLFDRTRSLSLHLFEHVHGESRDRGQAMVDLLRIYEEAGFSPTPTELPDYLPLFLEFLAVAPSETAHAMLSQAAPIIDQLHARLLARAQPPARAYAAVAAAALAEAGALPQAKSTAADEQADEDELAALDAAYEDAPVVFGPESDPDRSNVRASMSAMISRLKRLRASGAL